MDDKISRLAAIEAISEYGSIWMEYTDNMSIREVSERALKASKRSMIRILKDLPPVQERKKGKWIPHGMEDGNAFPVYTYSECGILVGINTSNFCPNCGADCRV